MFDGIEVISKLNCCVEEKKSKKEKRKAKNN